MPLVEEIRTTKDSVAKRKSDMKYKLDRIKQMREEMKRLAVEIREKDELVKQLMEELSKLPKQVQRTGYTRRIMDIMKNIEKQQITISGILKDTRETQKEINTASEVRSRRPLLHTALQPSLVRCRMQVLGRSYTLADDLVFRAAKEKEDDPARKRSCARPVVYLFRLPTPWPPDTKWWSTCTPSSPACARVSRRRGR